MLFGPPGAGKSTFIRAHATEADTIVDSDIEADKLGIDRYTVNNSERVRILEARNNALRRLAEDPAPRAWFAAIGHKAKIRSHWLNALKPKRIIVLLTPPQLCIERIKATRATNIESQIAAVTAFYKNFEPRGGEEVIKDWGQTDPIGLDGWPLS